MKAWLCVAVAASTASAAPIVGGAVDMGDPAVVAIAHRRIACDAAPAVTCSGVLIAPRIVLTAAHCLTGISPRGALEVVFGSDASAPASVIVVESTQVYAGYDPSTGDGDLAVLLLAEDAPIAPYPRPTSTIADATTGAPLRAVGFGITASTAADLGVKRTGTLALGAVRAASFDAAPSPAMTCTGDSGGPVFATIGTGEQLVGLTSRGDAACATVATNARVDVAQASFIDPFVSASTGAPLGWPNSSPPIGNITCSTDAECPALMSCTAQQTCGFSWLGPGSFAGACATDGDCGDGRCARVWPTGADACHCFAGDLPPSADAGTGGDPPPDAGCGCAARGQGGGPMLLAVVLVLVRRRRVAYDRATR